MMITEYKDIGIDTYLDLKTKSDKVKLVDIRTHDEYRQEHIEGSISVPIDEIENFKVDPKDIIVIHCKSGGRTNAYKYEFGNFGLDTVYILKGGLLAWKQSGQPTV